MNAASAINLDLMDQLIFDTPSAPPEVRAALARKDLANMQDWAAGLKVFAPILSGTQLLYAAVERQGLGSAEMGPALWAAAERDRQADSSDHLRGDEGR